MQVRDKIIVVTGAGDGIGRALADRFAAEGAARIVVADIDGAKAQAVARRVGGESFGVDVADAKAVGEMIDRIEREVGAIDLYCSNAGILRLDPVDGTCADASDGDWQASWSVNVMSHVYAARALLPRMIRRGGGAFLITVSAAGLLSQIGSGPYSVTKHAALAFAECLAIAHGHQGIEVAALCPQAVATPMIAGHEDSVASVDGVLTPEDVAASVVEGLRAETFLILPHPQVRQYMERKATDYERWLAGMRRLSERLRAGQ